MSEGAGPACRLGWGRADSPGQGPEEPTPQPLGSPTPRPGLCPTQTPTWSLPAPGLASQGSEPEP